MTFYLIRINIIYDYILGSIRMLTNSIDNGEKLRLQILQYIKYLEITEDKEELEGWKFQEIIYVVTNKFTNKKELDGYCIEDNKYLLKKKPHILNSINWNKLTNGLEIEKNIAEKSPIDMVYDIHNIPYSIHNIPNPIYTLNIPNGLNANTKVKLQTIHCNEQGGIIITNINQTGFKWFREHVKFPYYTSRQRYLLDNYIIDYDSFYECASSPYSNKVYSRLTNKEAILDFLTVDIK